MSTSQFPHSEIVGVVAKIAFGLGIIGLVLIIWPSDTIISVLMLAAPVILLLLAVGLISKGSWQLMTSGQMGAAILERYKALREEAERLEAATSQA